MGQLYTVRSLECTNWSTLKVNLKSSFGSLATSRYIINPYFLIRSSESWPFRFFEGTCKSIRWFCNWPWTLTGYLRSNIGRRPSSKKTGNRKTLNSHLPKNQPSSFAYGFFRPGLGTTCKISKNGPKNQLFFWKFWKTKKSYVLTTPVAP
jgi:hypothetical protein